ncbi:succinate dehydrogenase, hydrophobic membrane anchor protein [Thioflexithrix psekupsensis]|uniref:Succinate dehydrogenase hydrophobic membrane anchor subunit n=1 Tax=Thioflexithrix psekupsensis TaxID=1570016 RepID=A0A251X4Y9_9GAMM|nr:succinate dehydrogenase, hydrophobic membrane anchor protein [Thioflexithrix psekupsensis]OUD12425.1 succinate dehydrogenase, hydrophobic membrane anchor protein [Thioflexithrix psekupsensis]
MQPNDLRAPLARVRGLGSAREGTEHYIAQRFTAVALVPLAVWFVFSLVTIAGADYNTVVAWVKTPINAILLIALLMAMFHHAQLGMRVVIEDYVSNEFYKVVLVTLAKSLSYIFGIATVLAVVRVFVLGG